MTKILSILVLCFFFLNSNAQNKPAYKIFSSDGTVIDYIDMKDSLLNSELILFGEMHNNPISHWLQLEVTQDIYNALYDTMKQDSSILVLGAEMIEADNQTQLNDYLMDSITYKGLDTLARLWGNYKTDYAPLVDFAKDNGLNFIGTNIPRRYAKVVYRKSFTGLDTLSDLEKSWIAPLPIRFDKDIKTYQDILTLMGEHGTPELVQAQAIKDATMAHFILTNMVENGKFIHYNGSWHSDYHEGIAWYIKTERPNLSYATITTVSQKDLSALDDEHKDKADFIICVDEDMTTTY